MGERSQDEQDLRATSDSIRQDAEKVAELEEAKSRVDVDDPAMRRLASQVEQLTDDIERKAEAEQELSRSVDRESKRRRNRQDHRPE